MRRGLKPSFSKEIPQGVVLKLLRLVALGRLFQCELHEFWFNPNRMFPRVFPDNMPNIESHKRMIQPLHFLKTFHLENLSYAFCEQ